MEWINPHTWIHLEVTAPSEVAGTWRVEGGPPNTLYRRGFTKNSLLPGTVIHVDGYQAKDGSHDRERATGDARRRPQAVPGLLGHRRAARRRRIRVRSLPAPVAAPDSKRGKHWVYPRSQFATRSRDSMRDPSRRSSIALASLRRPRRRRLRRGFQHPENGERQARSLRDLRHRQPHAVRARYQVRRPEGHAQGRGRRDRQADGGAPGHGEPRQQGRSRRASQGRRRLGRPVRQGRRLQLLLDRHGRADLSRSTASTAPRSSTIRRTDGCRRCPRPARCGARTTTRTRSRTPAKPTGSRTGNDPYDGPESLSTAIAASTSASPPCPRCRCRTTTSRGSCRPTTT